MVPIGIGPRIRSTGKGKFNCPNCESRQPYRRECRAQYFYLFFLPVVPLNEWPEYVLCENCCQQFDKSILFHNPNIEREERERRPDRIKSAMIVMLLREQSISEAALACVEAAFLAEGGEAILRAELEQEIEDARQLESDPLIDLIELSQQLKPKGPSTVLQYAWLAAASNGKVSDDQTSLLNQLRESLGVSEVAYDRLVARLSQSLTNPNNDSKPQS